MSFMTHESHLLAQKWYRTCLFVLLKHVWWHTRNLRWKITMNISVSIFEHALSCVCSISMCVFSIWLYCMHGYKCTHMNVYTVLIFELCMYCICVCVCVCASWTHHGRGGCGLVHLVLCCFDLGLQVCRRMEIFAFVPWAATLDVVHTHSDGVLAGVDHGAVSRVSKSAVCLATRAITTLVLTTHLTHTWRYVMTDLGMVTLRTAHAQTNMQTLNIYILKGTQYM